MTRAWLCVTASAAAAAVSIMGCAPGAETSSAPAVARAASPQALVDLGHGLVYDEALDVTWLQDARYAQTSGYDGDGLMTFEEANAWATALVFAGASGWRLPTFDPSNPRPTSATGANEIGSLYMALIAEHPGWPSTTDTSPFVNVLGGPVEPIYWTGVAGQPGTVWDYHMTCG
jgi:hypothetical protein